jgi:hypothetical protein
MECGALAQSLGQPTLTALAATILARRKNYYEVLEASNKQNEITNWLMWFASVAIEALRRTIATVEFLIDKTKMLDRLKGQLNDRRKRHSSACSAKGPRDFEAGLPPENTAPSPGRHQRRRHGTSWIWLPKGRWLVRVNVVTLGIVSVSL